MDLLFNSHMSLKKSNGFEYSEGFIQLQLLSRFGSLGVDNDMSRCSRQLVRFLQGGACLCGFDG